ncbi:MAG: hypothetical protein GC191_06850 [Azospirillum sp.]|nr:hypothetical protein [Azospirillum sp.]
MAASSNVLVIYTGGTIGMMPTDPGNPASPLRPAPQEQLVRYVPNPLDGIAWQITGIQDDDGRPVAPLDSSSIGPRHWMWIARAIERHYAEYDGFVVLHGTDTMAFTASALSFLLHNLAKPVVLTGAQLPIFAARTDARANFTSALTIAGWRASGLPCIPEVTLCFAEKLLRGNRASKTSTWRWQGFDSPNYPALGQFGEHIVVNQDLIRPAPDPIAAPFSVDRGLSGEVITLALSPGMTAEQIRSVLELPKVRGYVLQTFGSGNAPENPAFLAVLDAAVRSDKVIVSVTQCREGSVDMGRYAASSGLQAAGVISGLDMTTEAALTKLMWLIGSAAAQDIVGQAQVDQRGEQSESLFDLRFGAVGAPAAPVSGPVTVSAFPPQRFDKSRLKRAVIRFAGVGLASAVPGQAIRFGLFVNRAGGDGITATTLPPDFLPPDFLPPDLAARFAGWLDGVAAEAGCLLIGDITATIQAEIAPGAAISLTLVPPEGAGLWYSGADLNLFAKAG